MHLIPTDPLLCVAAFRWADGLVLVALAVFTWWGARRGALRQMLSLAVLVGAFWGAGRLAPHLEGTVEKLTSLEASARLAAAWGALVFSGLVLGAIVLSFACCRLPDRAGGGASRVFGAVLGLVKGGFVLVVTGYVLLSATGAQPAPGLGRPAGEQTAQATLPSWLERVRGSVTAGALSAGADRLSTWLDLPAWIDARIGAVDEALHGEPATPRRPRDR